MRRRALLANPWRGNVRELENTHAPRRAARRGDEIGAEAIMTPDGEALGAGARATPPRVRWRPLRPSARALVGRTVADVERDLILDTLDHCLGNRTHAAKILGISIRTLRNKLNEYAAEGIAIPPPGEAPVAGL